MLVKASPTLPLTPNLPTHLNAKSSVVKPTENEEIEEEMEEERPTNTYPVTSRQRRDAPHLAHFHEVLAHDAAVFTPSTPVTAMAENNRTASRLYDG